jgi:hypothetical protein
VRKRERLGEKERERDGGRKRKEKEIKGGRERERGAYVASTYVPLSNN